MRLPLSIVFAFAVGILDVHGEGNVVELEASSFDKWVAHGKPALVELYVSDSKKYHPADFRLAGHLGGKLL
jgi:hypothetical protein